MRAKTAVLGVTACISLLLAAPAFAEGPKAGDVTEGSLKGKTMTFVSYGGIYQDGQMASLKEFIDKSGVNLLSDGPTEVAKLKAQVESGNVQWDVVDTGDITPYVHCGTLFQKLDMSKIDTSNIPAGQVGECSVPAMNYGIVVNYKNDAFGDNAPKSWADFFDVEKFPGMRAIEGDTTPAVYMLERALIADGVDIKNLKPEHIDQAFKKLKGMREHLLFWTTGAQSQQMMESGEAEFVVAWSGRAMGAVKNGAKYGQIWDGWIVTMDQLTIPVGVKDTDAAYALINYAIGQKAQEIMAEQTSYSPIHKDAKPKVDEIVQRFMTNTPERQAQGHQQNLPFWVANYADVSAKWADFLAGN